MAAEMIRQNAGAEKFVLGPQLQWEVEQFLYEEAAMLDDRRYEEWLALLEDDMTYVMPLNTDRLRRDAKRFKVPNEINLFDDNLERLKIRVRRIRSGTAWSEDPRSRARHTVSNIQIAAGAQPGEIEVTSVFLVYVSRMDEAATIFSGKRLDTLRRSAEGQLRMASRYIIGDQSVIPSNNLTIFF
jgi:3-phenylpropionate/cinnamic acid dioxygenase small subunit